MSSRFSVNYASNTDCSTQSVLQQRREYADYFRTFDWNWYITLTFAHVIGPQEAHRRLTNYFDEVEKEIRASISCLIMPERAESGLGKPAGRTHFHLLVRCPERTRPIIFQHLWSNNKYGASPQFGAGSHVVRYDPAISATHYLFKTLGRSDAEWWMKLPELAAPASSGDAKPLNARERRLRARQANCYAQAPMISMPPSESFAEEQGVNARVAVAA